MLSELGRTVVEVGTLLLDWRRQGLGQGHWVGHQFKAEADAQAHAALIDRLGALDRSVPIVSEEDPCSYLSQRPDRYWLIDPLDGTASFGAGFPGFVTQVALMDSCAPQVAAVYAPALRLLYLAERHKGTTLNGTNLRLHSKDMTRSRTLVDNYPEPRGAARAAFDELAFGRYLESGSIGLKICRVADGSADVFFKDVLVRDWDLAAPHLVLQEAGGVLTGLDGLPLTYTGGYERPGLVAARSSEECISLAAWYSGYVQRKQTS